MSVLAQSIPEGYKQTEVGIIPESWEVRKLKEISPSQSVGLVINPSSYYAADGTIPMLVGSHVKENRINWVNANKISPESNRKLPASRLNKSDLVTVRVGEPGVTAVIPPELDKANCASMMIVRKGEKFDSRWLCFLMNSKIGKERIEGVQYGTAQKQFNIVDAVDFLFPFPLKTEQSAIANTLSDVDALLMELEKLIAKKQAIKTATMQQLLTGKTRLPQFATHTEDEKQGQVKGTKPSELGKIPEDWDIKPLGELVIIQSGESPSKYQFNSDGVPYFKVEQLNNGRVYAEETEYRINTKKVIKASSIIFPKRGASILLNKIRILKNDSFMDTNLMTLTCENDLNSLFLYNILTYKGLDKVADTTSIPQINNKHIIPFLIPVPSVIEQGAIATILSDMDNEIQTLEQRLKKTRQIKQGMMQELLTGRTRLPL
jgi:type I restriction enzyme S subunit